MRHLIRLLSVMTVLALAACGTPAAVKAPVDETARIAELAGAIRAMGADIDPDEAQRAASIAYSYTRQLAIEYEITDPPLIHNMKVNAGLRPRGLCWHWAEDMERRLKQENFQTLDLHRAIANADNAFRIEHSTAIISRRGENMFQGIVLDPWRKGGILHWSPTSADPDYVWQDRAVVFEMKRQRRASRALQATAD